MNIVLVYIDGFRDEWLVYQTSDLPMGLALVRAYSRRDPLINKHCRFFNKVYIDTTSSEVIAQDILLREPQVVCFNVSLWNYEKTKAVWRILKNRSRNVKIVLGGAMVPDGIEEDKKRMLDDNREIDAMICGEGEIPFRQLLRFYLKKETVSDIPNIALREKGQVFISPIRTYLKDLSQLPSPYLSGDMKVQENATGFLALETSRGCIYRCNFCRFHGKEQARLFNIERVKKEVEFIKKKNFRGKLYVTDPILNFDIKQAKNVLKILEGIDDFRISIDVRPELVDDEMIELFKKIPGLDLNVGLQSTNPIALKKANRPANIDKCKEVILKLTKNKINTAIQLILGLSGDNYETFKETLAWGFYTKAGQIKVFDLVILPSSDLEAQAKEFGIQCDSDKVVLSNDTFSEQDMIRASHFTAGFLFLLKYYRQIFDKLVFEQRFTVSEVIEKIVLAAQKTGDMPMSRVGSFADVKFSERTLFQFLKTLFTDKSAIKHFLLLFKRHSRSVKTDASYVEDFMENQDAPGNSALKANKVNSYIISDTFKQCWKDYRFDVQPIDRRMDILDRRMVEGMSSKNIRFLINELVRRLPKGGVYLEIGTYQGSSLLSAVLFNPTKRCIGIDDFSEFDHYSIVKHMSAQNHFLQENNAFILRANLKKFKSPQNVLFIRNSYQAGLKELFLKEKDLKIDFFFYDGPHTFKDQINAMRMVLPYLAKQCIILVDDTNQMHLRKANRVFLKETRDFKLLVSISTKKTVSETWWNGIEILARGYR